MNEHIVDLPYKCVLVRTTELTPRLKVEIAKFLVMKWYSNISIISVS